MNSSLPPGVGAQEIHRLVERFRALRQSGEHRHYNEAQTVIERSGAEATQVVVRIATTRTRSATRLAG